MRVEPQNPVPDRLQTDPADAGCLRARAAVVDLRKCQQTTPLGSALRRPGQPAKPCRIIVPACCNPRSHGESPLRHHRFPRASFGQASMSQHDRDLVLEAFVNDLCAGIPKTRGTDQKSALRYSACGIVTANDSYSAL